MCYTGWCPNEIKAGYCIGACKGEPFACEYIDKEMDGLIDDVENCIYEGWEP